jgi:hypothetical protein
MGRQLSNRLATGDPANPWSWWALAWALVLIFGSMAQAATVPSPTWSTQLKGETGSATVSAFKMAAASDGSVMAVWVASDGTTSSIYSNHFASSTGWGKPVLIESSTMPADSPQLAGDGAGNYIAVWRQAWKTVNGTLYGIYSNRYTAGSGWSSTSSVVYLDTANTSVTANADPMVVMNASGHAFAIWSVYDWNWNHNSVRSNRYTPGSGWAGVTNLSTESIQRAQEGNIAIDATGNAMAVWSQYTGTTSSTQGIVAVRYTVGSGWGTPVAIESAALTAARPGSAAQIAWDASGNALAVWYQYSKPGIFSNRYTAGAGWGATQTIADIGTTSYDDGVTLALDKNGNGLALWNQSGGVLYANRYTPGVGWGTTEIIESNGSDYSTQVAFDGNGNALAVWTNYSCNSYNIESSRYVVGTGWSPVARCYEASTTFVNKAVMDYASAPQILIDASSGRATAMWIQRGSLYAASAAGYTAPVTPSDCVFNWAEATYPAHFPANGVASQSVLDYYYRYYPVLNAYLATASRDNHVYYFGPLTQNTLLDLGALSQFQSVTGCK